MFYATTSVPSETSFAGSASASDESDALSSFVATDVSDEASAVASEDTPLSLETSVLATSAVSFVASELVDTSVVSAPYLRGQTF